MRRVLTALEKMLVVGKFSIEDLTRLEIIDQLHSLNLLLLLHHNPSHEHSLALPFLEAPDLVCCPPRTNAFHESFNLLLTAFEPATSEEVRIFDFTRIGPPSLCIDTTHHRIFRFSELPVRYPFFIDGGNTG